MDNERHRFGNFRRGEFDDVEVAHILPHSLMSLEGDFEMVRYLHRS